MRDEDEGWSCPTNYPGFRGNIMENEIVVESTNSNGNNPNIFLLD